MYRLTDIVHSVALHFMGLHVLCLVNNENKFIVIASFVSTVKMTSIRTM